MEIFQEEGILELLRNLNYWRYTKLFPESMSYLENKIHEQFNTQ